LVYEEYLVYEGYRVCVKSFNNIEDLIKAVLVYPRRVTCIKEEDYLGFKADDNMLFSIGWKDYYHSLKNASYRATVLAKAIKDSDSDQYCESLNYGKPSLEE